MEIKEVQVKIPAGIPDGATLRVSEQGGEGQEGGRERSRLWIATWPCLLLIMVPSSCSCRCEMPAMLVFAGGNEVTCTCRCQ